MKSGSSALAAICGIALLALGALASAAPASADSHRHRWDGDRQHDLRDRWRHPDRPQIGFGSRRHRYVGEERYRYFGVGPNSYECYGYDCNW